MMKRQMPPGISITQSETDYRHFYARIEGPAGTPYEGGSFPIEVFCPDAPKQYPLVPPQCIFRCKIYHPNVNAHG